MKKYIFFLFLAFALNACHDDNYEDTNFIPDITFSTSVNLNLPQSQNLRIPTQFVVYPSIGHRGVIVYNTGFGAQSVDQYLAFDLACPHVVLTSCASPMDITDFPELKNSCTTDNIFYNFELGYSRTYSKDEENRQIQIEGTAYELQQYRAELINPDVLRISNF
jgi:hypothetical protein